MKQLSVFLENKQGALLSVLDTLKAAGIQLIATTLADTTDFGICRIICTHPTTACNALQQAGIAVTLAEVVAIALDNQPGAAANAIRELDRQHVEITYLYSFLLAAQGILILRTNQPDKAREILLLEHANILNDKELRQLAEG